MEENMKDTGNSIKEMEEEDVYFLMVMFMKENGEMIWHMEMVITIIMMVVSLKDHGKIIYKMASVKKNGQMEMSIKDFISKAPKMVKVHSIIQPDQNLLVNLKKIKYMDLVQKPGLIKEFMKETGKIIKCMGKEHLNGRMVKSI